ncbi:MAG: formylglycine-generating enzyme family protein, partial [Planctomycetota bacterium]
IRWVTYDTNGMAYSYGTRLVIRGNYSCDLDEGRETDTGPDWKWDMPTSATRYLAPYREAWFKMMRRNIAQPDGMVWVYIDEPVNIASLWFEGYMSKYETTNAQYCQYLNSALDDGLITVYSDEVYAFDDSSHSEPYFQTYPEYDHSQIAYGGGTFSVRTRDSNDMSNHPVVKVSWFGATAFCDYYGFKLPTEWQWQAVADFDGTYTYGCGTTIDPNKANYYLGDGNFCNPLGLTSPPYTAPVDHYPSFGYGMNNMAGNVKEWSRNYFYMVNMDPFYRVLRGGSFGVADFLCTVSLRGYTNPSLMNPDFGFRAILNLE